eukprot:scaffold120372_cov69-Phaeocystis_antarctica.AAC.1
MAVLELRTLALQSDWPEQSGPAQRHTLSRRVARLVEHLCIPFLDSPTLLKPLAGPPFAAVRALNQEPVALVAPRLSHASRMLLQQGE